MAILAAGGLAQNTVWSTHDWTISVPPAPFEEGWVDVKMPGGFPLTVSAGDTRRTYVVGTVNVTSTGPGALFSNFPVGTGGLTPSTSTAPRQVVMLQCNQTTSAGSGSQVWQRFFFGQANPGNLERASNARAVSVWEGSTVPATRIAICGETYDDFLEFSQVAPTGWIGASGAGATGFIAVYNGVGDVKWTYHFFSDNNPGGVNPLDNCAITDVSIRVDAQGREIVTYCGVFTHGDPGAGSALSPLREFTAPPGFSGGATTQAAGQFDGFVGRLVHVGGVTTRVFHSIVGGPGQDGLFGLCEIDENVFAVVGSTTKSAAQTGTFPIDLLPPTTPGPWSIGAVLVFDASATSLPTPGNLAFVNGRRLGSLGSVATFACDVCVGRNHVIGNLDALGDMLYIVGTTSDPAFSTDPVTIGVPGGWQTAPPAAQAVFNGPTDGFLAAVAVFAPPWAGIYGPTAPWTYSYWGGPAGAGLGDDGLTGVSNWNEWSDQVGVVGYTTRNGDLDIGTSTFFFNTAYGSTVGLGNTAFANDTEQLHQIRDAILGGAGADVPTDLGAVNATTGYVTFPFGAANGGGIAMGNDGRTNVVGATLPVIGAVGYPLAGGGRAADLGVDAARSELDLLPRSQPGTGRTDGTGFQAGAGPYPPPPAVASGGTTPACALSPFGVRVGATAPVLQRMLIDYQGTQPAPGVSDGAIMVSRPTVQPGSLALSTLQVGLPPAVPWLVLSGTEFWLGNPGASSLMMTDVGQANRPLRFRLPAFPSTSPPGTQTLSMQAASLLVTPIGSGTCSSLWTASPAIFFTY